MKTNFSARTHGFPFANSFTNTIFTLPKGWRVATLLRLGFRGVEKNNRISIVSDGLCGGMSFAALDYYYANIPPPEKVESDNLNIVFSLNAKWFAGNKEEGLISYLHERQLDSFNLTDVFRFFRYIYMPDDDRSWSKGIQSVTLKEQLQKLVHELKAGHPCALALIHSYKLANFNLNHQVVCYGYKVDENGNVKLEIYDPNFPGEEKILCCRDKGKYWVYEGDNKKWRGFFVQNYYKVLPPLKQ